MNILVTGGAGFIGSHLIQALQKLEHSVVNIDELNDYYNPGFKRYNLAQLEPHPFYQLNITDGRALDQVFNKHHFDLIVHLGARAGVRPSLTQADLYNRVNVIGTMNLLNAAVKYGVPRIIFGSTSAVYGNNNTVPFVEDADVSRTISPYATSKRTAELLFENFHQDHKLKVTIFRFFTVYGERGRPDMAPYLFTEAIFKGLPINKYGDGKSSRDYTYIGDIIQGLLAGIANPFDFEVINLGNNNAVSLNEFISTLEQVTGKQAIINPHPKHAADMNHTWANITKAKQLLNYQPTTSLREGLEKFVAWYQANRA